MEGGEGRRGGEVGVRGTARPADGDGEGRREKKNAVWTFPGWEIQRRAERGREEDCFQPLVSDTKTDLRG